VFVCTGILSLLKDENGKYENRLASLLGHEIGTPICLFHSLIKDIVLQVNGLSLLLSI
jgi:hypothetical protein